MPHGKSGNNHCMKKKISEKKLNSEIIVDFLVSKKVTDVFDLSGGMIAYLEDAISKRKNIKCFPMHHEQGAGFAAEGYGRISQNFGVAMATSGPGATNLLTAIGSCYFDSTPTMFIVGQVHTESIKKNDSVRQEGFQETDIVKITTPLTKYAVIVTDPKKVLYELEKTYYIMKSGRSGSVLIDIPINIQRTEVDLNSLPHFIGSREYKKMEKENKLLSKPLNSKKITNLETLLKKAKAPLVIIGNGVRLSETSEELYDFVKRNNTPVVASLMGLDSYPHTEMFIGYVGSNGNRDANIVFANADLIIALGTRLDVRQTGAPQFFNQSATIVHVDIDKSSINYIIQSHLSFETDLVTFFTHTKNSTTPKKLKWFNFISSVQKIFARPLLYSPSYVDANTFMHELSLQTPKNTTIVADVGQNQQWCAQSWRVKKEQRVLYSGGMGAMGFALPAAVGAWCASPKSNIVVITGDGGLQINIQELETVSRNKIPLKLFVLNNKSLGMVREFQDLYFNKNYQSTVIGYGCPDLKKLAAAYDFKYEYIKGVSSGDEVIKSVLARNSPVLIEVDIDVTASLSPKIVYGHALDDQAPYLNDEQKIFLEQLKATLRAS